MFRGNRISGLHSTLYLGRCGLAMASNLLFPYWTTPISVCGLPKVSILLESDFLFETFKIIVQLKFFLVSSIQLKKDENYELGQVKST